MEHMNDEPGADSLAGAAGTVGLQSLPLPLKARILVCARPAPQRQSSGY